jgi:hypothetical protein
LDLTDYFDCLHDSSRDQKKGGAIAKVAKFARLIAEIQGETCVDLSNSIGITPLVVRCPDYA